MAQLNKINFEEKFAKFSSYWTPKIIAKMNNHEFKVVKLKGEFTMHHHLDTDETFIVMEGKLKILFNDKEIELEKGEMIVIPKGIEHKPIAENECKVLIIEKERTLNTGNKKNDLTADNNIWI